MWRLSACFSMVPSWFVSNVESSICHSASPCGNGRVCYMKHTAYVYIARRCTLHASAWCIAAVTVQVTASVVIDRFRSSFSFCLVSDSPRFSLKSAMLVACGVVPIAELKSLRLITPSPLASSSCHALHSNASAIVSGTVCVRARARASRDCASLWA